MNASKYKVNFPDDLWGFIHKLRQMSENQYSKFRKEFRDFEFDFKPNFQFLSSDQINISPDRLKQVLNELGISNEYGERIITYGIKCSDNKDAVLIKGEMGTGKDLIAKAIHKCGPRSKKPFVIVNCSMIPKDLIYSELFGYEKGAFTDAKRKKLGKFEDANGGTIFLDEIGDLPIETQNGILRVVEDGTFSRLGQENSEVKVDVKLISATNKPIDNPSWREKNEFRDDLYYRINILPCYTIPLRGEISKLLFLLTRFILESNDRVEKPVTFLTFEFLCRTLYYDWPGNIRELKNFITFITNEIRYETGAPSSFIIENAFGDFIGHDLLYDIDALIERELAPQLKFPINIYKDAPLSLKQIIELSESDLFFPDTDRIFDSWNGNSKKCILSIAKYFERNRCFIKAAAETSEAAVRDKKKHFPTGNGGPDDQDQLKKYGKAFEDFEFAYFTKIFQIHSDKTDNAIAKITGLSPKTVKKKRELYRLDSIQKEDD